MFWWEDFCPALVILIVSVELSGTSGCDDAHDDVKEKILKLPANINFIESSMEGSLL